MQEIYESVILKQCKRFDLFDSDVILENYDWSEMFRLYELSQQFSILESFERLNDTLKNNATHHNYSITTKSGSSYRVLISYYDENTSYEIANSSETSSNFKKDNILASNYNKLKNDLLKTNEKICMINFITDTGESNLTNSEGLGALEVFQTVVDVLKDSLLSRGMIANTGAISMRIDKNESKRIQLYEKILKRYLGDKFPTMFLDSTTDNNYSLLYAIK